MGINLGEIPKTPTQISLLSGKKFAVDAFNTIYQFLSSIRQPDGTPLMDSSGSPTGHLAGIFYRNSKLLENGIKLIYVFDGVPPDFKSQTLSERQQRKYEAEIEWKIALEKGDLEHAKKFAQATSKITKEIIEESKTLLSLMGIPVIDAPSEGEAQAVYLVKQGLADAVASQDMDSLLFGAPKLLRNLSISGKRKVPSKNEYQEVEPEFIDLNEVLAHFQIDLKRLIWMGLLIGTDFNEGVKGIGPKKAHKIVKDSNTLEEVVEKAGAKDLIEEFKRVEAFFLYPPVNQKVAISFGKIQKEEIIEFLCEKHDFSKERVQRTIENTEKKLKEIGGQTKLDSWL
jgi:flap endonuclease-1